jgi:hypothetical protein
MNPRRQESTEPRETDKAPAPTEHKATKPLNPMSAAVKAQAAIDKINKRESDALANARARYQAERDEVYAGLSDAVKRILAAAAVEEPEA